MERELAKKLSSEALQALADLERDPKARLSVLLTVVGPLEADQVGQLAELGIRVRTVAGHVVTADLPIHAVSELVALAFVRYVELPRMLRRE